VYGYTPAYIDVATNYFLVHTTDGIVVTVDGTPLTNIGVIGGSIRAFIDFSLSDGDHEVVAMIPDGGVDLTTSWNFSVDRNSSTAIFPQVTPCYPHNGASMEGFPSHIMAWINFSAPDPRMMNVTMELDGVPLPASIFGEIEQLVDVSTTGLGFSTVGEHHLRVWTIWDGDELHEWGWSFNVTGEPRQPSLLPVFPIEGSLVLSVPAYLEVQFDPGFPSAEVINIQAYLDDQSIDAYLLSDGLVRAHLSDLPNGEHRAVIFVNSTRGLLEARWNFSTARYAAPGPDGAQLANYNYQGQYHLLLPINWTITEDILLSNSKSSIINITAYGPVHDGITTTVVLQDGIDPSISDSPDALWNWAYQKLTELYDNGYSADYYQDVQMLGSHGLYGITFSVLAVPRSMEPIVQRLTLIVDEPHHHYWTITCTSSLLSYPLYDIPFFQIGTSVDESSTISINDEQLAEYQYGYDFKLFAPRSWTLNHNQTVQGRLFNLTGLGPAINNFATNFNLQVEIVPSITGTNAELLQYAQTTITGLQIAGYDVSTYEVPTYVQKGELSGMIFSVKWPSYDMIQKMAIMVNTTNHKVWMFTFSVSSGAYEPYSPLFNTMALSIAAADGAPVNPGGDDNNGNGGSEVDPGVNGGFGKDVLIVGAYLGVAITVVAIIGSVIYFRRK
jgi:hypothetical protein